jgi:ribosomal protein S18 acetylase RimI-like enzyme
MDILEEVTEKLHNGYFVDLYVRQSNANAIGMYRKVGQPAPRSPLLPHGRLKICLLGFLLATAPMIFL